MTNHRPLIALDISRHDHLHVGFGVYRYAVDLVHGLAVSRPNVDFVLIGSNPEPVAEVRSVFEEVGSRWSYHQIQRRERRRGAYFLDQWSIVRQLGRLPIRLYHSTDFFVPLALPVPLVMTVYDIIFEQYAGRRIYREPLYLTCLKRAIRHRVARVIAISRTTASDLHVRWKIPTSKLMVTHLGTRLSNHTGKGRVAECAESRELVLLSRYALNPWKNLPALVEALALLRREFTSVKLLLFGKVDAGPEREAEFDESLRQLGIQDAVERLGVVSEDELRSLYERATIFVLPSLYEGFGLTLIEAMACGVCVVAHNASAMAEVVGEAGCLTDARRPEVLAGAIAPLLREESRRAQLARAGRRQASRFTIEAMAEATFDVYRSCLQR